MGIIQNLLEKKQVKYDETLGYLTKDDMEKLREAAQRKIKNKTYNTWECNGCGRSCYYETFKCEMCGSCEIKQIVHPSHAARTFEVKLETNGG